MLLHQTTLLALIPLLASSCAMTPAGGGAGGGQPGQVRADKPSDDTAVELAQVELEIARLEAASSVRRAENTVKNAEIDLQEERAEMASFVAGREIRLRESAAGLQRSKVRLEEQQAELSELESMYAAEEFAEKTKELVLSRGKNQLAAAQEGLEIEKLKRARLEAHELPADQLARQQALDKAEAGLRDAREGLETARLSAQVSVMRKEKALSEATEKAGKGDA